MIPEMMNMPTFEQYTMHKQDNKVFALVLEFVVLNLLYGRQGVGVCVRHRVWQGLLGRVPLLFLG